MAGESASGKTDLEDIKTKNRNGDMKMRQDDSDASSDSSSSSSGDDEIPLLPAITTSSKQQQPKKKKKERPADDNGNPEKKRKKRKFLYSPIDPKDKCGKCKNCLNPHFKKACIPAREKQERERQGQVKEEEEEEERQEKVDPFRAALLAIIDELSCIKLSHIDDYISLCREEMELKNMTPLVNALHKSVITAADNSKRKELGRAFIQQGGLTPIEAWLPILTKARKEKALLKLLTILDELPISVKEIKTPSTLGKSVTMVMKDEMIGEEIKKNARAVIVKWKALLKARVTSETNTKKHATADVATVTKNTTTLEDDVDLFKTADKHKIALSAAKSKSNTSITISNNNINNNKVTTTTTSLEQQQQPNKPLKSQTSSAAAAASGGGGTTATTKPTMTPSSTSRGGGGFSTYFGGATSILDTIAPLRKIAGSTAAEKAARAAAAVKDPDPLPKKIKSKKVRWADDGDGSSGGSGSKKTKLVSSRLFLMTDPAEAAKQDVDITRITAALSSHGGTSDGADTGTWASAKRKEHLNEASALALHRREEDREKGEIAERMGQLHPQIQWYDPPLSEFIASLEQQKQDVEQGRADPGDDYKGHLLPGRGEDSEERHRLAALREREGGGGIVGGGGGGDAMLPPEEPSDPRMWGHRLDHSNMVEIRLENRTESGGEQNGSNNSAVQMPGINNLLAQLTASGVLEQQRQHAPPPQPPTWQPQGLVLQKPLPAVPHGNAAPPPMLQQNRRRCTFWNSDKGCSNGVNCKFLHEGPGKYAQRGGGGPGGGKGGGGGRGSSFYTRPLVGLHGKK